MQNILSTIQHYNTLEEKEHLSVVLMDAQEELQCLDSLLQTYQNSPEVPCFTGCITI